MPPLNPKLNNVYIGERYIPLYDGQWDGSKAYEGLTIVYYNNNSYISKRPVPSGIEITNETYWALQSTLPGQVQQLQEQIQQNTQDISTINSQIENGEIGAAYQIWTSAESLNILPNGEDIGELLNNLPDSVKNIAFPPGTYSLTTAATVNVPVLFAPGAIIDLSAKLTLSAPISAPPVQLFSFQTYGSVSIRNYEQWAEWYGVLPGTTTPAPSVPFNWSGKTIKFSRPATYTFTGNWLIDDCILVGTNLNLYGTSYTTQHYTKISGLKLSGSYFTGHYIYLDNCTLNSLISIQSYHVFFFNCNLKTTNIILDKCEWIMLPSITNQYISLNTDGTEYKNVEIIDSVLHFSYVFIGTFNKNINANFTNCEFRCVYTSPQAVIKPVATPIVQTQSYITFNNCQFYNCLISTAQLTNDTLLCLNCIISGPISTSSTYTLFGTFINCAITGDFSWTGTILINCNQVTQTNASNAKIAINSPNGYSRIPGLLTS